MNIFFLLKKLRLFTTLWLCSFCVVAVQAQTKTLIAGTVVDGAGRPVSGATIKLLPKYNDMSALFQPYKDFLTIKGEVVISLTTGPQGEFRTRTTYAVKDLGFAIGKDGYIGFVKSARLTLAKSPIVIYRSSSCDEAAALASQSGETLKGSLTDVITSNEFKWDFGSSSGCHLLDELFKVSDHLLPVLRSTPHNRFTLAREAKLISIFGEDEDKARLLSDTKHSFGLDSDECNEIRGDIAGGLVTPQTPEQWQFLENIISCNHRYLDEDGDSTEVPFEEAALALSANGSARALATLKLKSRCERAPAPESEIRLAIRWIESHPGPVESLPDLKSSIESAARVFNYSRNPERFSVNRIVMNESKQKAFVSGTVDGGGEYYYYKMVFKSVGNRWALQGIWPDGIAN